MFEISDLKSKKLPELQEIADGLKVPKYKTLKKIRPSLSNFRRSGCKPKSSSRRHSVKRYLPTAENHKSEHQDQRNQEFKKLQIILKKRGIKRKGL